MSEWNPDLYMQFKSERTQPSIDLIARVDLVEPKTILDIGCGPGNSTQALVNRWPGAKVTGLDSSATMIQKAQQDFPGQDWLVADASTYSSEVKFDLVFSNAVIQWIPNHDLLLKHFHGLLSEGGGLAVQIPLFWDMPLGKIIKEVANEEGWRSRVEDVASLFTIHGYAFYYDQLISLFRSVEIWKTDYMHVLDSHSSIIEMMRSTGLKPYHDRLGSEAERDCFDEAVLREVIKTYPVQQNGKVILPFHRLFFIGYK